MGVMRKGGYTPGGLYVKLFMFSAKLVKIDDTNVLFFSDLKLLSHNDVLFLVKFVKIKHFAIY